MMEHEEELQNRIESGANAEGRDAEAYRAVFRALSREPSYHLPADFAEKVAGRAALKKTRRFSGEYLWLAAAVLFVVASFVVTLSLLKVRLDFGFLSILAEYKGFLLFGLAIVLLLDVLDKKLVRDRHARI